MSTTLEITTPARDALPLVEASIDLTNVKMKLADREEGQGLSPDELAIMEREYFRFLALHLAYPNDEIVPCKIVDEMWHRHILDTAAYRDDCDALFGKFLDHFPYFGMRGEEDAQALVDAYAETIEKYRLNFGEPADATWIAADASRCSRTACKPQRCK